MATPLRFEKISEWRNWLKKNGRRKREAWLIISKKHVRDSGLHLREAVDEAICFGWIDGRLTRRNDDTYLLRFSPRKEGSVWSEINKRRATELLDEGRMTEDGIRQINEAKRNGRWTHAYSSRNQPMIPSDFEAKFKGNPTAWMKFSALSNSHKLSYLFWIEQAKKEETRARRIDRAIQMIVGE